MKCKICNRNFETLRGLSCHVKTHKITTKEYYLKFLKKEGDGFCKYCGKESILFGINGYSVFCSSACLYAYLSTDETINNKRSNSMLKTWQNPNSLLHSLERSEKISIGLKDKKFGKERIKNLSISHMGQIAWNKDKPGCFSNESLNKMSESQKKTRQDPNSYWHSEAYEILKEDIRQIMLNGRAIKMLKKMKKISKGEIKLRELVKELFPDCDFQHGVLNYSLDVALPQYKIAIEYDGYFHFNNPENIEYHKIRQKRIEDEGWVFYRVTMYDKFPSIDQIKKDIETIIENKK